MTKTKTSIQKVELKVDEPAKKVKKTYPKARKWCFTSFKKDINFTHIWEENKDIIRYLVVQGEVSPKTKKFHWQGYIQMFNQCRMRKLKLTFNDMAIHLETQRGTNEQASDYCKKIKSATGQKYEFGKPTTQGARNDLEHIKKLIDDGGDCLDVANDHFSDFIRYHSGIQKYKQLVEKKNRSANRDLTVELISGPTNTGKSHDVRAKYPDCYVIESGEKAEWWDGYCGEKVILFDDYSNDIKINRLLRLLDKYKCRLPIKGGFTWANWDKVFITTNLTQTEIHSNARTEHRTALFRRIDVITRKLDKGRGPECLDVSKGNTIL